MKNDYDMEVKKVLKLAEKEMFNLNHPYVGSEHMMMAILKLNCDTSKLLESYGLTYDNFKENLIKAVGRCKKKSTIALYTPLLKRIISGALEDARECGDGILRVSDLIVSMLEEGEGICVRILLNMNIDVEGIYNDLKRHIVGGNHDKVIYEIGKVMKGKEERVFKRDDEIKSLIEILLRKNKNNPLLLGEAGVGKTAIVEELARRIEEGNVPPFLQDYKIIELDTGSLISGTRYRGDFEDRLNKIIDEIISDGHIILFIDEIHTLVNCGGAEGAIDAANILKPYLARGDVKVIGATTNREYKNSIYKDKALNRRFEIIDVCEPSPKDTEYILMHVKEYYESHHNVIISNENIKDIIKYSNKYIFNKYNPDKSIDILDSVCAHVQLDRPNKRSALSNLYKKKEKLLNQKKYKDVLETELKIKNLEENTDRIQITRKDILNVIEYKANMPILDHFNDKLMNLSGTIKTIVLGQDKSIDMISDALKQKYLCDNFKPLSILIEGPSGVGKTFCAKSIANNLFGDKHYLRLDCSELSNEMSVSKLLGSTQGYVGYDDQILLSKINDYPYSIILLDEVEKADKKVLNIFNQIINDGVVKNGKGEEIHFENTTIIMTSNSSHNNSIGFNNNTSKSDNGDDIKSKVDLVVRFNTIDDVIARKYLFRECTSYKLTKREIDTLIKDADIYKCGIRGLQRELNKYKINKILSKA